MQEHVFQHKRKNNGEVVRSRTFYGCFKLSGDTKPTIINLGVTDKQVARVELRRIVLNAERERAGIIPPKSERDAATKPLGKYLEDFVLNLSARGKAPAYVYYIEKRLQKLLAACGWAFLKDVTPESFEKWRNEQDAAPKTKNEYLSAAITFLKWILRNKGNENPLASVERVETRGRERRKRRVLCDEEMERFLKAAGERAVVYTIAALTGIRRNELSLLKWGDFEDCGKTCYLNLRSETTKNKDSNRLPLHPVVANLLRKVRPEDVTTESGIFALIPSMWIYRRDLAAAGIEYKDALGRQFDFHALRHTFDTNLLRANVPLAVSMFLMRHKQAGLTTGTYLDKTRLPVASEIGKMPWLGNHDTEKDTEGNVFSGHGMSHDVNGTKSTDDSESRINRGFAGDLSQNVAACHNAKKAVPLGFERWQQCRLTACYISMTPASLLSA